MATKLRAGVRLSREVNAATYGALTVTLTAEGILLREKGRRGEFLLGYGLAYLTAVRVSTGVKATGSNSAGPVKRKAVKRVSRGLLTT